MRASHLESPRTLLSILVDLSNSIVWMILARLPIYSSSSSLIKSSGNVPSAPFTVGITITFMFHHFFFFSSLVRYKYWSLFSLSRFIIIIIIIIILAHWVECLLMIREI